MVSAGSFKFLQGIHAPGVWSHYDHYKCGHHVPRTAIKGSSLEGSVKALGGFHGLAGRSKMGASGCEVFGPALEGPVKMEPAYSGICNRL